MSSFELLSSRKNFIPSSKVTFLLLTTIPNLSLSAKSLITFAPWFLAPALQSCIINGISSFIFWRASMNALPWLAPRFCFSISYLPLLVCSPWLFNTNANISLFLRLRLTETPLSILLLVLAVVLSSKGGIKLPRNVIIVDILATQRTPAFSELALRHWNVLIANALVTQRMFVIPNLLPSRASEIPRATSSSLQIFFRWRSFWW